MTRTIAIVGAGIGGLAAAHAVRNVGHEAVVLERAACPTAVGAGLVLWPNAVRALDELGLGEQVRAVAAVATETRLLDATGRVLSRIDAAQIGRRAGAPMLLVERPPLHAALAAGLDIRTGVHVTDPDAINADGLIGADGINSTLRACRFAASPRDTLPLETGKTAIRAVAPYDIGAGTAFEAWGAGELCGVAGLPDGRTYWFYETDTARIDPADPLAAVRARHWPDPLPDVIAATDPQDLLVHPVRTLPKLKTWARGTTALLGDAAHAMAPNLGQGAAQAIEDAAALQRALGDHEDIATAFAAYAQARRPRATMIQRESARMARLALSRRTELRNAAMRAVPDVLRSRAVARLVG